MQNENKKFNPILGFDELFESGAIVDSTGISLEEVDLLMREYLSKNPVLRPIKRKTT